MLALKELDTIRLNRITSVNSLHKEEFAQYLTPIEIASYMAKLTIKYWNNKNFVNILDPGAGLGILSCCLVNELLNQNNDIKINLDAYEIDKTIISELNSAYKKLDDNNKFNYNIYIDNFITNVSFDISWKINKKYDLIIMNPPYKKIPSNSEYRKSLHDIGIETVNTYSAFIAIAIKALVDNGILTAIVPRSFCNGLYFLPFRKYLLDNTIILHIHSFESRKETFKEEDILQENIIICLKKQVKEQNNVIISHSVNKSFEFYNENEIAFSKIVDIRNKQLFISIPNNDVEEEDIFQLTHSNIDLGFEISTGPIVDFRVKEKLIYNYGANDKGIPILYSVHIRDQKINWPLISKRPNLILLDDFEIEKLAFRTGYYILVKRFSAKEEKRRIWATLMTDKDLNADYFTVENHLNIIHYKRNGLDKDLALGLAAYLNTRHCDNIFRKFSGHTQVNATDLKSMKYPDPDLILKFGKLVQGKGIAEYDKIFKDLTGKNGKQN